MKIRGSMAPGRASPSLVDQSQSCMERALNLSVVNDCVFLTIRAVAKRLKKEGGGCVLYCPVKSANNI